MEILRLENITFAYSGEGSLALDHVSLSIESGKYYSIIGHNGSGKSTLAKLIMGLLSPKDGNIVIGYYNFDEFAIKYWLTDSNNDYVPIYKYNSLDEGEYKLSAQELCGEKGVGDPKEKTIIIEYPKKEN